MNTEIKIVISGSFRKYLNDIGIAIANFEKANFLYLANIGGCVGQSAATEMGVALMSGVPIVVAEEVKDFSNEMPETAQELLKKSVFRKLPTSEISSEKIAELNLANFRPFNLSSDETKLLQSLVEKLLESLKFVKIPV